jgi:hypothetical protein
MQGGEALSAIGALDTSKEERKRLAKLWVVAPVSIQTPSPIEQSADPLGRQNGSALLALAGIASSSLTHPRCPRRYPKSQKLRLKLAGGMRIHLSRFLGGDYRMPMETRPSRRSTPGGKRHIDRRYTRYRLQVL